ncbi:hypothetical protein KTS45_10015 [Halomicroarcula limicola]|uniref:Uncharacterized protein n=1 Tax=Haloarcula limicola TaxID=1429915 RepID=A0A8J7YDJ3_9EURY|nr:hypothetical protein [Halomicroarcula limicola]MBV0924533.1 hypothetical protein [Halomicroarcula limicola]
MGRQNHEDSGNDSPVSTSLDDFTADSEKTDSELRHDGGFSGKDMTRVMEESNLTGSHLEKEILPVILASEFDVDPETMNDGMIPDRETGIQYDAYAPNESDPWIVAWATQVKQGHFNKNFQKNLGELLFLKSHFPDATTVMVFGTYATKDSDVSRAEDYLETYSLFWDTVINVTQEEPIEYKEVNPSDQARKAGQNALEKELDQIQSRAGYAGDKPITLPAITGFADNYTSLAKLVLQRDDWLNNFDEDWFLAELDDLRDEYELHDVFKRFDHGLTPSLVRDGLREAYYSLTNLSRGSKMRQLVENGDLEEFYYEMFEHGNPAKRWDYFNPTEGTVYAILDQKLDDDITIEWSSNGITSDGFVHQLGILSKKYEWDIKLNGETDIYIEVKSLSGGKGGSGPKQAGYEAHRVAGRSFLTRYALKGDNVSEKDRHHIIVLDGYWRGPSSYENKSLDFFKQIAGFDGVYMIDDVDRMLNDIESLLDY